MRQREYDDQTKIFEQSCLLIIGCRCLGHPQGYVIGVDVIYNMFVILKTKTQKNPPFDTFLLPFELPKFAYI